MKQCIYHCGKYSLENYGNRQIPSNQEVRRAEIIMVKKSDQNPDDWEPPWVHPANDRKTPYTEKELEDFAEEFILSMSDSAKLKSMIEKDGIEKVTKILKDSLRKQDENNLINMFVKGSSH